MVGDHLGHGHHLRDDLHPALYGLVAPTASDAGMTSQVTYPSGLKTSSTRRTPLLYFFVVVQLCRLLDRYRRRNKIVRQQTRCCQPWSHARPRSGRDRGWRCCRCCPWTATKSTGHGHEPTIAKKTVAPPRVPR